MDDNYARVDVSVTFPLLTSEILTEFIGESTKSGRTAWLWKLRAWTSEKRKQ